VQVSRALSRSHAVGVVHRDIKPDNIFLAEVDDDDGAGIIVKVLDFGVARVSVVEEGQHSNTRTGVVIGTPLYMSPEQARALKSIDGRADLYSLGIVAYSMLTNQVPFSAESFGDLVYQICTSPLPPITAVRPDLPPAIDEWFFRASACDPNKRFATA